MAYDYRYTQRTTTTNRPGAAPRRRNFYAPPPPASGQRSSHHHGFFTYWMPLVVTGTLALGGLAAWIWHEREKEEHEHDGDHNRPPRPPTGAGKPYPTQGSQAYPGPPPPQQGYPGPPGGGPPPPQQQGSQGYPGPPPGGPPPPQQQQGQRPPPQQGPGGPPPPPGGGEAASYYDQSQSYRGSKQTSESRDAQQQQQDDGTWYGRVTGLMKRTPSPQQIYDSASKQVTAGMAALGSIMEDGHEEGVAPDGRGGAGAGYYDAEGRPKRRRRSDERLRRQEQSERNEREGFSDHERWSEEAEEQKDTRIGLVEADSERRADGARGARKGKGRAVAVVVSAETDAALAPGHAEAEGVEHASILSHLSPSIPSEADLFVLIYMPGLTSLPPTNYRPQTATSTTSTPAVHTPASELASISPRPASPVQDCSFNATPHFNALYTQALSLVPSSTRILPFSTRDGYVHILRHLAPSLVYVSDVLAGDDGAEIARLKGWVGHTVLVAGDAGVGGLVDTETETEAENEGEKGRDGEKKGGGRKARGEGKWYERSEMVGLGKEVEVVDVGRVGEDWARRVGGRE